MGLKVIVAATLDPVSLAEVKLQTKALDDDDTLLGLIIKAATDKAEQYMGAAIMQRTLDQTLDAFPGNVAALGWSSSAGLTSSAEIELAQPPAWNDKVPQPVPLSITSVSYVDVNGVAQTLAGSQYTLDDSNWPFWLLPAFNVDWPDTRDQANAVTIRYQLGYDSPAKVPGGIRAWLLMTAAFLWANREAVDVEGKMAEIPSRFIDSLLDPYRVFKV